MWPRTKWSWAGELAGQPGNVELKIHRGKNLLLPPATIALAGPVCAAEIDRMRGEDAGWRRLIDHLAAAGPTAVDDLQVELGLAPKELRALRSPLERCGAVVARSIVRPAGEGEGHVHTSELALFTQAVPDAEAGDPVAAALDLVVAGVRAAVTAPEDEVRRWFSWSWYLGRDAVACLVDAGRLSRPAPGWVAARMGA